MLGGNLGCEKEALYVDKASGGLSAFWERERKTEREVLWSLLWQILGNPVDYLLNPQ